MTKRLGNFKMDSIVKEYLLFPVNHFTSKEKRELAACVRLRCTNALDHQNPNKIPDAFFDDDIINYILAYKELDNTRPLSEQGIFFMHSLFYTYDECSNIRDLLKNKTIQLRLLLNKSDYDIHEKIIARISVFLLDLIKILQQYNLCSDTELPLDTSILKNLYDLVACNKFTGFNDDWHLMAKRFIAIGNFLKTKDSDNMILSKPAVWNLICPRVFNLNSKQLSSALFVSNLELILKSPEIPQFRFNIETLTHSSADLAYWDVKMLNRLLETENELELAQIRLLISINKAYSKRNVRLRVDDTIIFNVLTKKYTSDTWSQIMAYIDECITSNFTQPVQGTNQPHARNYPNYTLLKEYMVSLGLNEKEDKNYFPPNDWQNKINDRIEFSVSDKYSALELEILKSFTNIKRYFPLVDYLSEISLSQLVNPNTSFVTALKLDLLIAVYVEFVKDYAVNSSDRVKIVSTDYLNSYMEFVGEKKSVDIRNEFKELFEKLTAKDSEPPASQASHISTSSAANTSQNGSLHEMNSPPPIPTSSRPPTLHSSSRPPSLPSSSQHPSSPISVNLPAITTPTNEPIAPNLPMNVNQCALICFRGVKNFIILNHFNILAISFIIMFYLIVLYLILMAYID